MDGSGVAAGNHSGNAVMAGNFSFFFSLFLLSINFWIGYLSFMSNSFGLSTGNDLWEDVSSYGWMVAFGKGVSLSKKLHSGKHFQN